MFSARGIRNIKQVVKRFHGTTGTCDHHSHHISAEKITKTKIGTGAGPFIEIPTVEPLPKCSSVLLKLPSSSKFFSKLANVSVISAENNNGGQTVELSQYNANLFKLETKVQSGNVILSTPLTKSFEAVYLTGDEYPGWSVLNGATNIAGFSEHVTLNDQNVGDSGITSANGWGIVLLMGKNLKVVELRPGQDVMIAPENLIGFQNGTGLNFTMENIKPEKTILGGLLSQIISISSTSNQNRFYKIQGPGKIIISC